MKQFKYKKHPDHKKHFIQKAVAWLAMFAFMSVAVYMVDMNYYDFKTSIIPTKNIPAFDGTVLPIRKAPNWVSLNSAEYGYTYNQLPANKLVNLPVYDPDKLKMSVSSLIWGNPADDAIRNAKITFSVPYMGNYELDGTEYSGSHLAVDIKIPKGTPVYAIANGQVDKVALLNSGFGNHIVIKHPNAPSLNNTNNKETIYSSYSHLDSINVSEGSIINKGDLIGYSGNSGLSTTPHLHFQIDKDTADWHPFWPFTSQEAANAGMSFTDAINKGLNQNIAIANTINPMVYVQKYLNGTTYDYEEPATDPIKKPITEEVTDRPAPVITEPIKEETTALADFEIVAPQTFEYRKKTEILIKALDANGDIITDFAPEERIRVEAKSGVAIIEPNSLTAEDFINGVAKIEVTSRSSTELQLRIKSDTIIKDSITFSKNTLFADIAEANPHYQAIKFLKNEGIIEGYPDGTFKPNNSVSRVEVIKFILEGLDTDLISAKNLTFKDTDSKQWYASYIYTALQNGIIEGYPDGSFKPTNSVNKVEFLKMLIEAMNIDVNPNVKNFTFTDIDKNQWYAPYVRFAIDKNLIEFEGRLFKPNEAMTREQVAEAIYRVKVLTETGASQYTAEIGNEFEAQLG
jgi:murein DD-endopeptidase MepM/ murein hydrolase activator NlpD